MSKDTTSYPDLRSKALSLAVKRMQVPPIRDGQMHLTTVVQYFHADPEEDGYQDEPNPDDDRLLILVKGDHGRTVDVFYAHKNDPASVHPCDDNPPVWWS